MTDYFVSWSIDISADSPEEAAKIARAIQTDLESTANVFEVSEAGGNIVKVDLQEWLEGED